MRLRLQSAATYTAWSLRPRDTKGRLLPLAAALGRAGQPSERVGAPVAQTRGSPARPWSTEGSGSAHLARGPSPASAARHHTRHRSRRPKLAPGRPHRAPLSARIHPAVNPAPGPPPVRPRPSPGRGTALLLCVGPAGRFPAPPPGAGANGLAAPRRGPPGTAGRRSGHAREPTVLTQQHCLLPAFAHPKQLFRWAEAGLGKAVWSLRKPLPNSRLALPQVIMFRVISEKV